MLHPNMASEYFNYPKARHTADTRLHAHKAWQAGNIQYTQSLQDAYIKNAAETGISRAFEGHISQSPTQSSLSLRWQCPRQRRHPCPQADSDPAL